VAAAEKKEAAAADGAEDGAEEGAELTRHASVWQRRSAEGEVKLLDSYVGGGLSAAEGTAMASAGVNVVRLTTSGADVGVGLRLDTGVAVRADGVKGYLAGFGGEVGYGTDGKVASVGVGLGLFKFNLKLDDLSLCGGSRLPASASRNPPRMSMLREDGQAEAAAAPA
jgi:hypothetical protein